MVASSIALLFGNLHRAWLFRHALQWRRLAGCLVGVFVGSLDAEGTVEFVAHFERDGEARQLHEISRFTRHEGHWVYVGPIAADA